MCGVFSGVFEELGFLSSVTAYETFKEGELQLPGTNGGSLRGFLGTHLPHRQERLFDFKSVALAGIDFKNSTYK